MCGVLPLVREFLLFAEHMFPEEKIVSELDEALRTPPGRTIKGWIGRRAKSRTNVAGLRASLLGSGMETHS
jgi:hypothetical protein